MTSSSTFEAADVTVLGGDLGSVADALELSRWTYRVIVQNLFWAFGYKIVMISLGVAGLLSRSGPRAPWPDPA